MAIVIPKNELNEFSLPRVCVATGATQGVSFQKVQFQYIPRWTAVFAIAPLLYVLFYFLVRKTAAGTLPFSDAAWSAVKAARRNVLLAVFALIASVFVGTFVSASLESPVVFLVGIVAGIGGLVVTSMKIRTVFPQATFIDNERLTLKLPSAAAEQSFEQHLKAGSTH